MSPMTQGTNPTSLPMHEHNVLANVMPRPTLQTLVGSVLTWKVLFAWF